MPAFAPAPVEWAPEEIRLIGKMPDEEVAKRIGRSPGAVKAQRLKRGLRHAPRPDHKPWTRKEERLLGKKTDEELAGN